MAETTITVKYTTAGATGVVNSQPYKAAAKFTDLAKWRYEDTLNKLKVFEFNVPNDEFHRANALFERDIFIPFLKPFNGFVVGRKRTSSDIQLTAEERATHLTRRTFTYDDEDIIKYTTEDWYNSAWKYRRKVSFNGDLLEDSIKNFPLQIHNRHAPDQPHSIVHAEADGKDFVVTLPDGVTPIPHEIEYWDAGDVEEIIRFKPPKLKDSNSVIAYLYYGNAAAVDSQDAAGVWDNEFALVYHFQQDPAITTYIDSTGNGNTGTPTSVTNGGGHHGNAPQFDGANSKIECGSGASIDDIFVAGGKLECWIHADTGGEGGVAIIAGKGINWILKIDDVSGSNYRIRFVKDFTTTDGEWRTDRTFVFGTEYKISIEYNEDSINNDPIFYVNGEIVTTNEVVTPVGTPVSDAGDNLVIGNNTGQTATFDGYIEEFRLHTVMRDNNWERSDYRNEVMDTNAYPIFGYFHPQEQYQLAANVIAQQILDSANTDMPAGVTWVLDQDFPTDNVQIQIKSKNHFQALHLLGEYLGKDIWFDNKTYIVYCGIKGKTLEEELEIEITSEPTETTETFGNIVRVKGDADDIGALLSGIATSETALRYNYEKVISDKSITTQAQADQIAANLLSQFQALTPQVVGTIPYPQFIRLNLESGDSVLISQPNKGLNGRFRVLSLTVSPNRVDITLEGEDTASIRIRSLSLSDVIDAMIRQNQDI